MHMASFMRRIGVLLADSHGKSCFRQLCSLGRLAVTLLPIWLGLLEASHAQVEIQPTSPVQEMARQFAPLQQDQRVDPYTGGLKISAQDVHLPGNGGLDITLFRIYDTDSINYAGALSYKWVGFGLGWSLNVAPRVMIAPVMSSPDLTGPLMPSENWFCTGTGVEAEYTLEHVDGRNERIAHVSTGIGRTTTNWELNCSGNPYFLRSPDGVKYELGIRHGDATRSVGRQATVLHTTKITDSNNNYINIAYQLLGTGESNLWAAYMPTSITSSDGRSVSFTYDPGVPLPSPNGHPPLLLSVTSNGVVLRQYTHTDDKLGRVNTTERFHD